MRIVETDNYGGDYPNEKFLNIPPITDPKLVAAITEAINNACCGPRYWKAVPNDYELQSGFEP